MNIYLVSRTDRVGYDEYDALVVIAKSEEDALLTGPFDDDDYSRLWAARENLEVTFLGKAVKGSERRCVLASFNAG